MEAQRMTQSVFDELYENDANTKYENNNMEKPTRRYLRASRKKKF